MKKKCAAIFLSFSWKQTLTPNVQAKGSLENWMGKRKQSTVSQEGNEEVKSCFI